MPDRMPLAIALRPGTPGRTPPPTTSRPPGSPSRSSRGHLRRRIPIHADSGGGIRGFLTWSTAPSRRLRYFIETNTEGMQQAIDAARTVSADQRR